MLSPRFTRGDLDGFFGLFVDNLLQLMLIGLLGPVVCGFTPDLIAERILPGAALSVLFGNLFYAHQARRLAEGFTWYYQRLLDQTRPVLAQLRESYEYYHRLAFLEPLLRKGLSQRLLETMGMVVVGTPEQCRKGLARYARAGVDRLLLAVGAGMVSSDVTRRSLELLAHEVLPALSDSHADAA